MKIKFITGETKIIEEDKVYILETENSYNFYKKMESRDTLSPVYSDILYIFPIRNVLSIES